MTWPTNSISIERLREVVSYDPATGVVVCRTDRGMLKSGDLAGYARKSDGRVCICLAYKLEALKVFGEFARSAL
jgi:hypothetical protein